MKMRSKRIVALLVIISVALTACGTPTATPEPQESASTTTTTTEATTTTTTAETATTTKTTAVTETTTTTAGTTTTTKQIPSVTKPVRGTGNPEATETTFPKGHALYQNNPPFEDNTAVPNEDKQQLLFKIGAEDVVFTFEKAMRYPKFNDELLWHYRGTTKKGISFICKVAAAKNQIFEMDCEMDYDETIIADTEAQTCIDRFIRDHSLQQIKDASLSEIRYAVKGTPEQPPFEVVQWVWNVKMERAGDYFTVDIRSGNGMIYVDRIESGHSQVEEGVLECHPYCLGDDFLPLLIPRWKSK